MSQSSLDKVVVLVNKIDSGLDEVKERSINNIYTKIRAKIVKMDEIIAKCIQLPGVLLQWINKH